MRGFAFINFNQKIFIEEFFSFEKYFLGIFLFKLFFSFLENQKKNKKKTFSESVRTEEGATDKIEQFRVDFGLKSIFRRKMNFKKFKFQISVVVTKDPNEMKVARLLVIN